MVERADRFENGYTGVRGYVSGVLDFLFGETLRILELDTFRIRFLLGES